MMPTRNTLLLTLLALSALAVLIALGVWQLRRLSWKTDLISRLERGIDAPAAPYAPPAANKGDSREFRHVQITGRLHAASSVKRYMPAPEAARAAAKEGFGYSVFTPVESGGHFVFVDRGFVPASQVDQVIAKEADTTATVTGLIRLSEKRGWFTPQGDPEKRVFYAADLPAMAAAAHEDKTKIVTSEYIEADATPNPGGWPLGRDPRSLLAAIPNSHLQYALTWFGLAAALMGVFSVYIARPEHWKKVR